MKSKSPIRISVSMEKIQEAENDRMSIQRDGIELLYCRVKRIRTRRGDSQILSVTFYLGRDLEPAAFRYHIELREPVIKGHRPQGKVHHRGKDSAGVLPIAGDRWNAAFSRGARTAIISFH